MGVVSQELGRATGDRMEKLKARHDDLSKEASILERLQKNTVTSSSSPALTNTRLEALQDRQGRGNENPGRHGGHEERPGGRY